MAALKSVNRMYGVCFHAARQAAGLKASRLVQHRTFQISVSYGKITSLQYYAYILKNAWLLAMGMG